MDIYKDRPRMISWGYAKPEAKSPGILYGIEVVYKEYIEGTEEILFTVFQKDWLKKDIFLKFQRNSSPTIVDIRELEGKIPEDLLEVFKKDKNIPEKIRSNIKGLQLSPKA